MNTRVLLGFLAGVLATAGVGYYLSHTAAATPAARVETPSPVLVAAVGPVPAQTAPTPVVSSPVKNEAPAPAVKAEVKKVSRIRPVKSAPALSPAEIVPQLAATEPERLAAVPPTPPQEIVKVTPPPAAETLPAPPPPVVQTPPLQSQPEPPAPNTVTLPSGTLIPVRLGEALSTKRNKAGDTFTATLDQPIVADGFVIAERGARVEGRVVQAEEAGRVKGLAQLAIELTRINTADGQRIAVRTASFIKTGPESKGEDAAKIGIGAVLGTIIGAAAGGGKGAAVGAAAGGAAGTGTVMATRGKPAELPVETRISFRLDQPVTITERRL